MKYLAPAWLGGMVIAIFASVTPVAAKVDAVEFETSAQAALYQDLVGELRCLVCDNQSLSDSNADLAQDLRRKVAEMIRRGDDRDAIVDYMVDRYGHFVLYRPPVSASTLLLWFGPFVVFLLALVALFRHTRRQARESVPKHSEDRLSEARALLKDGDDS